MYFEMNMSEKKLEKLIASLDFEELNILQVSKMLGEEYDLSMISSALIRLKKKNELVPQNTFGKCGIDPEANPCGDASEY